MRQLFKIDESEKRRILEMHENATKRNYLMEQPTSSPTTPPQQSPEAETEITGEKTIKNLKDNESLNMFINWGITDLKNPEITKNWKELSFKASDYMSRMLGLGTTSELTSTEEVKSKVESVYKDLENIAQNYTLSQLCGGKTVEGYTPTNPKSIEIARARVKMILGWCGKTQTQLDREAKKLKK